MKVNKGNILKAACDYVRAARQLEEEHRVAASKIQDFEKVAQCLAQRVQVILNWAKIFLWIYSCILCFY